MLRLLRQIGLLLGQFAGPAGAGEARQRLVDSLLGVLQVHDGLFLRIGRLARLGLVQRLGRLAHFPGGLLGAARCGRKFLARLFRSALAQGFRKLRVLRQIAQLAGQLLRRLAQALLKLARHGQFVDRGRLGRVAEGVLANDGFPDLLADTQQLAGRIARLGQLVGLALDLLLLGDDIRQFLGQLVRPLAELVGVLREVRLTLQGLLFVQNLVDLAEKFLPLTQPLQPLVQIEDPQPQRPEDLLEFVDDLGLRAGGRRSQPLLEQLRDGGHVLGDEGPLGLPDGLPQDLGRLGFGRLQQRGQLDHLGGQFLEMPLVGPLLGHLVGVRQPRVRIGVRVGLADRGTDGHTQYGKSNPHHHVRAFHRALLVKLSAAVPLTPPPPRKDHSLSLLGLVVGSNTVSASAFPFFFIDSSRSSDH